MLSSNDENVPGLVVNYYFLNERDSLISFAILPLCRSDAKSLSSVTNKRVFLCGTAVNGPQEVCKQVVSWRLTSHDEQPKVWVLSKEGKWIKLSKPRRSYKERFRTLMVTLQWLHCLKREPEVSEKALWHRLHKVFSSFEVRPSKDDLTGHISLIKIFADRHKTLANSQLLSMCLKENVGRKSASSRIAEIESFEEKLTIGHANDVKKNTNDADGDNPGSFDSVCAICDNGGKITCCDGRCQRSFHATKGSGKIVGCESLGYSMGQLKAMQKFYCKNCQYNQHQCFACGKLGSSNKTADTEVFPCDFASCGHFYHPNCVAKLLFQENEVQARNFQRKIAVGDSFICPYHKCTVCGQGENEKIYELQFAICRRCPKSYHRKCLPRNISFKDCGPHIFQRAWTGLLHNRILIYCLKHEIDKDLQAPRRNHIIFPEMTEKNDKRNLPKVPEKNDKQNLPRVLEKNDKWVLPKISKKNVKQNLPQIPEKNKKKILVKKRKLPVDLCKEGIPVEPSKFIEKLSLAADSEYNGQTDNIGAPQSDRFSKKVKFSEESKPSDYYDFPSADPTTDSVPEVMANIAGEECNSLFPEIDSESICRIKFLMCELSSLTNSEDVNENSRKEYSHAFSVKHTDLNIKHGKVEGSFEATLTTCQKQDSGEPKEENLVLSINYSTDEVMKGFGSQYS